MSALLGNPYAEDLEDYSDPRNSLDAVATLALAYEQRTANLIALWSMPEELAAGLASASGKDGDGVDKDIYAGVADQILGRLGL